VPRHPSSNTDPAASNAQTSGRADNNPGPQPWEDGLTIDEGVTWMIADEAGLDGRALAKAGQAAHTTLRMLRAAARAPSAAQSRGSSRTRAPVSTSPPGVGRGVQDERSWVMAAVYAQTTADA